MLHKRKSTSSCYSIVPFEPGFLTKTKKNVPDDGKKRTMIQDRIERPLQNSFILRLPCDFIISEEALYRTKEEIVCGLTAFSKVKRIALIQHLEELGVVKVGFNQDFNVNTASVKAFVERLMSKGNKDYKEFADVLVNLEATLATKKEEHNNPVVPVKDINMDQFLRKHTNTGHIYAMYRPIFGANMDLILDTCVFAPRFFKDLNYDPKKLCGYIVRTGLPQILPSDHYLWFMKEIISRITDMQGSGKPILNAPMLCGDGKIVEVDFVTNLFMFFEKGAPWFVMEHTLTNIRPCGVAMRLQYSSICDEETAAPSENKIKIQCIGEQERMQVWNLAK